MWSLRDNLFKLFGDAEKRADKHKDAEGRGLKERFIRALGAEFDEGLLPLVDNFLANCLAPETALARFVPYLENQMGVNYQVSDQLAVRRKLIAWAPRITRIKGTARSYEILLKLMGFETVQIVEHAVGVGFDSGRTLDDEDREFDGGCAGCSEYDVVLSGTLEMNDDIRAWIRSVVVFCEPINAKLRDILYNGHAIPLGNLNIAIDADGDLLYDNTGDPGVTLSLNGDGDLIIRGDAGLRYRLDDNGDLISR